MWSRNREGDGGRVPKFASCKLFILLVLPVVMCFKVYQVDGDVFQRGVTTCWKMKRSQAQRGGSQHYSTSPPFHADQSHHHSMNSSSTTSSHPPGKLEPIKWDASTPITQNIRQEYNAISDPYCPYTRTKHFKRHIAKQMKLEKLSHDQLSKSASLDLNTGLITSTKNDRPTSAPNKGNNHVVPPYMSSSQPSMTISVEPVGNILESESELEVLKTIILREGYLTRLWKIIQKLEKKFKPEIADLLDLIRMASVDVVEAISEWRKVKV